MELLLRDPVDLGKCSFFEKNGLLNNEIGQIAIFLHLSEGKDLGTKIQDYTEIRKPKGIVQKWRNEFIGVEMLACIIVLGLNNC